MIFILIIIKLLNQLNFFKKEISKVELIENKSERITFKKKKKNPKKVISEKE